MVGTELVLVEKTRDDLDNRDMLATSFTKRY